MLSETCVREDCRSSDADTETMRYDGMISSVSSRLVSLDVASDGVGETMTQVDPSISKPNTSEGAGQVHLRPSLDIVLVVDCSGEVLPDRVE